MDTDSQYTFETVNSYATTTSEIPTTPVASTSSNGPYFIPQTVLSSIVALGKKRKVEGADGDIEMSKWRCLDN